jgi:hydrogenase maturation protease HycI
MDLPELKKFKRLSVVGVGSDLRGDDAAGVEVVRKLKNLRSSRVQLIEGGVAPENFAEQILQFNPSHILLIDSAELGLEPGSISLLEIKKIKGNAIFTHKLPLSILVEYLRGKTDAKICMIGIQPQSQEMGEKLSPAAIKAIEKVSGEIRSACQKVISGQYLDI